MNTQKVRQGLEATELLPEMPRPGNLCTELCVTNLHIHSSIHVFTESLLSVRPCA